MANAANNRERSVGLVMAVDEPEPIELDVGSVASEVESVGSVISGGEGVGVGLITTPWELGTADDSVLPVGEGDIFW